MRSAVWWTVPRIVAESLEAVPDPLLTALRPGPPACGTAVASALARSLGTAEAADPAPDWLTPEQAGSFRQVLAALRRHGAAVLADPVGSGKTYVALAVAAVLNRGPTACLVPATLTAQWRATAARLEVPITLCSHQQASRGKLPGGTRGLVIIDESHHFRNPRTRRYRHVAPWLVGRSALLVTATPVVNRASDLASQLLLGTRDDELLLDGIVSLRGLLTRGCTAAALGRLVIECERVSCGRPEATRVTSWPTLRESAEAAETLARLRRLRLSSSAPIAALIRNILLRAAGSSSAALDAALTRYRRLLLNAADALRAGRPIDRAEIRRFTAALGDQLVWWELMPQLDSKSDLELTDLDTIDDLIEAVRGETTRSEEKLDRLCDILGDGVPSLIFTGFRETVRHLRDRIPQPAIAWCTGERAGIGCTRLKRESVLGWFRKDAAGEHAPRHLVVTDVAAEGLDLQRAGRVVHYDLPWTPMRVEQREGRSVRCGSRFKQVEVVRFAAPAALERALGIESTLARKQRLPAQIGLGSGGNRVWRWRNQLASSFGKAEALEGTARVVSQYEGLLAGFKLQTSTDNPLLLSATVLWLERNGSWTEAPEIVTRRLEEAAGQRGRQPIDASQLSDWLALLSRPIKDRLALTGSRRWVVPEPEPAVRRLAARLQALTREAARLHQPDRLMRLERAIGFVTRGHTAGEAILIERLADSSDVELAAGLGGFPPGCPPWRGIEVRLTGLILFGPAAELASMPWRDCKPSCSISTEP